MVRELNDRIVQRCPEVWIFEPIASHVFGGLLKRFCPKFGVVGTFRWDECAWDGYFDL